MNAAVCRPCCDMTAGAQRNKIPRCQCDWLVLLVDHVTQSPGLRTCRQARCDQPLPEKCSLSRWSVSINPARRTISHQLLALDGLFDIPEIHLVGIIDRDRQVFSIPAKDGLNHQPTVSP